MKAIIDRIEDGVAVLLPQPDEKYPIHWPTGHLPKGAREGSVLIITMEVDHDETHKRQQKARDLIQRLKNKHK